MLTKLILLGISFLALFQLQEALKTDIIIPSQRDHINSMFKKLENGPIIKIYIDSYFIFFDMQLCEKSKDS